MLTIDRLRLHLPSEYQDRAQLIARLVVDQLDQISLGKSRKIERLSLAPIAIAAGLPDLQLARVIATAVQTQLGGRAGSGENFR